MSNQHFPGYMALRKTAHSIQVSMISSRIRLIRHRLAETQWKPDLKMPDNEKSVTVTLFRMHRTIVST